MRTLPSIVAAAVVVLGASPAFAQEPAQEEEESWSPAPAAPPANEPAPEAPKQKTIGVLRLDTGFALREVHGLPITGATAGAGLGMERKWFALRGSLQGMFGSTEHGLSTRAGTLLFEADFILDRFRLGGGLGATVVGIDRALRSETLTSSGPTLLGALRVDIVRPEGFTVFARATIVYAALLAGPDTSYWGPTIGAGIDFDLAGRGQ